VADQDEEELDEAASAEPEDLSDEIVKKYDPERLLSVVARRAGKGEQLDHQLRARYERRFGVDLGHVRIYTGEFAEEFTRKRDAYAVTIADTGMILMSGSPEKSMASAAGQALLAHELTHAAQAQRHVARAGREGPAMEFAEEHEAEAEQVEAEVAAEEQGGGGDDGGKGGGREAADAKNAQEDLRFLVMQRVFDMLAEAGRADIMRNGGDPRRP
jgi:hypothetical protein